MDIEDLFRGRCVKFTNFLSQRCGECPCVILKIILINTNEEGVQHSRTSPAVLENPFCSSTDLACCVAAATVDWTLPVMVWSGPRARAPIELSKDWNQLRNRLEIPCLSVEWVLTGKGPLAYSLTYCQFQSRV